ncbi:MAG: DUF2281 domain-containing protein [Chloroflexota bacterium]
MTLIEQIQNQAQKLPPEKQREALDFITFLQQRISNPVSSQTKKRKRLEKAFNTLAELGTFADITDPVEWQRQNRKDKPLPGRDS